MASPLISVGDLARRLDSGDVITLLDVRWSLTEPAGLPEFRRGHIPGAQFVDLDAELAAPPGPGRHPLPEAETFAAAMRRHGVRTDRPVVVYDAGPALAAARAWWDLRYFGHRDVRVLDGGLAAWVAAGRPLNVGDEAPPADGEFVADPGHMPLLDAAGAWRMAQTGVLLDARAPERFRGEVEPIDPVAGHIPGAHNLPTTGNVGADGRFLPPAELLRRLDSVAPAREPIGAYCGSGVTAAHEVLALVSAGLVPSLYVGSWSEWITDSSRPVALGQG